MATVELQEFITTEKLKNDILKELKNEIEREFIETLRNNVIDPYKTSTLFSNKFVFAYEGTVRYKHIIRLKFKVYRRHEFFRQLDKKRHIYLGMVYVTVKLPSPSS